MFCCLCNKREGKQHPGYSVSYTHVPSSVIQKWHDPVSVLKGSPWERQTGPLTVTTQEGWSVWAQEQGQLQGCVVSAVTQDPALSRVLVWKVFCCNYLEILNNSQTKGITFSFCIGLCRSQSLPCMWELLLANADGERDGPGKSNAPWRMKNKMKVGEDITLTFAHRCERT